MPSGNTKRASRSKASMTRRNQHPLSNKAEGFGTSPSSNYGPSSPKSVTRRQHRRQNGGATHPVRRSRSKAARAEQKAAADAGLEVAAATRHARADSFAAAGAHSGGGSATEEEEEADASPSVLPPQPVPSENGWHTRMHALVPNLESDADLEEWVVVHDDEEEDSPGTSTAAEDVPPPAPSKPFFFF